MKEIETTIAKLNSEKVKVKEGENLVCENKSSDGKECPKKSEKRLYENGSSWVCFSCFMFLKYLSPKPADVQPAVEKKDPAGPEIKEERVGTLEKATNLHKEGKITEDQLVKIKEAFKEEPKKARKLLRKLTK